MNESRVDTTENDCSPVFSIAGVMPGRATIAWKTAHPDPDAAFPRPRRRSHGPTFTVAGVVHGDPVAPWRTAMPDPTRDTLDAQGHIITKVEAAARAELAARRELPSLAARHHGDAGRHAA